MTEFFKKPSTKRWAPFVMVLFSALLEELGKIGFTWVTAIDPSLSWTSVTWQQKAALVFSISIGTGTTFLKLKSRAWSDASKPEPVTQ